MAQVGYRFRYMEDGHLRQCRSTGVGKMLASYLVELRFLSATPRQTVPGIWLPHRIPGHQRIEMPPTTPQPARASFRLGCPAQRAHGITFSGRTWLLLS